MNKDFALVVDFDGTLIDSSNYKQSLFLLAKDFGVALIKANLAYKKTTEKQPFTVGRFSKILFLKNIQKQKQFQAKAKLIFIEPKQYNFLGVEKFLNNLQKTYELYLLTYGEKSHQLMKLKQSQLANFFNSIIVTTQAGKHDKLAKLHEKWGKQIAVLDDSADVCNIAKSLGIKSFQIRKGLKDEAYYNKLRLRINNYFQ